jgi:membrane protein
MSSARTDVSRMNDARRSDPLLPEHGRSRTLAPAVRELGDDTVQPESASRDVPAPAGTPANEQTNQQFLKRLWFEILDDDVAGEAAKVAYFAFLSLPPAFLVLFALTGMFGGDETATRIADQLERTLPSSASELIDDFVQDVVHEQAPGPLSFGFLLALWASSNVFMALGGALNKAYDVEENRSWVKRRLLAVGVMLVSALFLLVSSIVIFAGPSITAAVNLFGAAELLWTVLQWPLALLMVVAAFWIVYYVLPARDQKRDRSVILQGATAAALLWIATTATFRVYIANFASYSDTYGFLGAVIVLLLWLYITGIVVLAGGEINSELQWKNRR